jgi:hypothetical protein
MEVLGKDNVARFSVDCDGEVGGLQIRNGIPSLVAHRRVDREELDTALELRLLADDRDAEHEGKR